MAGYATHREYLLVVLESNRYQIDRTDARMNEAHRAHCRKIHARHTAELDAYDEAARVAALVKQPAEVVIDARPEVEL